MEEKHRWHSVGSRAPTVHEGLGEGFGGDRESCRNE